MILAAILFVLEVMAPGIFLMWFGMAAAVTGAIAFGFDIGWQWQLVWFCLLSLAAVLLALEISAQESACKASGRCSTSVRCSISASATILIDPIVNGRGSVKIGDSVWRVEGPELPKGARVRVIGADGTLLKVRRPSGRPRLSASCHISISRRR